MKILKYLMVLLFIFMIAAPASAWGPHGHTYLTNMAFEEKKSNIIIDCVPFKDAYLAGSVMPDITVAYYYSEGGKEYQATHNWNFQQRLMNEAQTPDEVCFANGFASHLVADSVAHTDVIPEAIVATSVPNWLLHPLLEKKYDSILVSLHPELREQTPHMLDAMNGPNGDRYFEMMENAFGDDSPINVRRETTNLAAALGTFYEDKYRPEDAVWYFKLYPYLDDLTNLVEPLAGPASSSNIDNVFYNTNDVVIEVFNNWDTRSSYSPHGFDELHAAETAESGIIGLMVLIFAFGLPFAIGVYFRVFTEVSYPVTGVIFTGALVIMVSIVAVIIYAIV